MKYDFIKENKEKLNGLTKCNIWVPTGEQYMGTNGRGIHSSGFQSAERKVYIIH